MLCCLHSALHISIDSEPKCYKARLAEILPSLNTLGSEEKAVCVKFEWTLLLYPHNWWSLHWSFVWRLRRHEEGIGLALHEQRLEWGVCTFAWGDGWHTGDSRVGLPVTTPMFGGAALGQTGWGLVPIWEGQYRGGGGKQGPPAAIEVCPSDQLWLSLKPSLDFNLWEGAEKGTHDKNRESRA